ncbi:2,3,4,5-tetrahydropyridine-2,6-dicarboxylate N-succinyltransferase [Acidobacteria bacterium AH-259-D05]|nr:2,3,4,5-tetrahydropyridine-2,6-dicarboxylate N-succinyltransferase [Acidobacteria bacterium AH-259-D05]
MIETIQELYHKDTFDSDDRKTLESFLDQLDAGMIRAAERVDGQWKVNAWVKQGILAGFRIGALTDQSVNEHFRFFDKDTFPLKSLQLSSGVRLVPGGSSVRRGAYVAEGVTCMPPMYINVGAYVDEGTMVDSHALVGSCAQIGKRVHLSAAAQIGGVLEPVGALPVIVEDEVLVGGNCGIYEGTILRRGAVLAAGVILTRGTPVHDLTRERVLRGDEEKPLEIPEGAVVVSGSRHISSDYAQAQGLALYTPIIVKYRDWKTEKSVQLEDWLR